MIQMFLNAFKAVCSFSGEHFLCGKFHERLKAFEIFFVCEILMCEFLFWIFFIEAEIFKI